MKTAKAKKLVLPAKILLGVLFACTVAAMILIIISLSSDLSSQNAGGDAIFYIPQFLIAFYYIYQGLCAFGGYALFYIFFGFYIVFLAAFILPHLFIERIKNKVVPVAVCLIFTVLLTVDAIISLRAGYTPLAAICDFLAAAASVFLTVVNNCDRVKNEKIAQRKK